MRIWFRVNKKHIFCCNCQLSVIKFLKRFRIFRTNWSYILKIIHEKLKDTSLGNPVLFFLSQNHKPRLLLIWATTALALGEDFWLSLCQDFHIPVCRGEFQHHSEFPPFVLNYNFVKERLIRLSFPKSWGLLLLWRDSGISELPILAPCRKVRLKIFSHCQWKTDLRRPFEQESNKCSGYLAAQGQKLCSVLQLCQLDKAFGSSKCSCRLSDVRIKH